MGFTLHHTAQIWLSFGAEMVSIFNDYQAADRRHLPARQYLLSLGSGWGYVAFCAKKHCPVESLQTGPARQCISTIGSSGAKKLLELAHRPAGTG
jgi:hypothetical protein